jgi:RNA polymerase sigma-70 factor (ECF subfamily)
MRRQARFDAAQGDIALQLEASVDEAPQEEELEDDRLRLIFTCRQLGSRTPHSNQS